MRLSSRLSERASGATLYARMRVYTIGHSNHTWDEFAGLLKQSGLAVLADTRSNPASRFASFANARTFPSLLDQEGIRYVYLGDSLGGKPSDPSNYDEKSNPDYRKIRSSDPFRQGIDELLNLAKESVVALMCAEEDPGKCHRWLLLGPALEERGVELLHIRGDGSVHGSDGLRDSKAYRKQLQGVLPLDDGGS